MLEELRRLRRKHLDQVVDPNHGMSQEGLRKVIADTFAEHWWNHDGGGCCCRRMKHGEDYTYHIADQVLSRLGALRAIELARYPAEGVN